MTANSWPPGSLGASCSMRPRKTVALRWECASKAVAAARESSRRMCLDAWKSSTCAAPKGCM
eukprot:3447003-Pyramimonas_sp.AAC.1